jgi:hypothetical protein
MPDHTCGNGPAPPPRVADGVDELPDAQSVRVPDTKRRQVHGSTLYAQQREVEVPAALHDPGVELPAVAQDHRSLRAATSASDDVVVREH